MSVMTKAEMVEGFAQGRVLIQEEWSTHGEIQAVDELIGEGMAVSTAWEWDDNFQCERRRTRRAEAGVCPDAR